jgi:TonB family protein
MFVCYARRVRLDSPAVLATAGTLAIHLLLAVAGDALVVLHPVRTYRPPPVVELFDIEPPELPPPPPPIEPAREPEVDERPPAPEPRVPRTSPRRIATRPATQTETPPPPPSNTPPPPAGGAPVAQMEGIAPSATGVPVARGRQSPTDRIGRGGTGTGTGSGSGAGAGEASRPVSVATIKTRAMPKGDFSYFDASKDYPAEAKALGIEGVIRVRLVVDEHGKVKSCVLLNRLGHGLDELALERAKRIEFEPAKDTEDRPVSSVVVWTFNMTLPK